MILYLMMKGGKQKNIIFFMSPLTLENQNPQKMLQMMAVFKVRDTAAEQYLGLYSSWESPPIYFDVVPQ